MQSLSAFLSIWPTGILDQEHFFLAKFVSIFEHLAHWNGPGVLFFAKFVSIFFEHLAHWHGMIREHF